MACFFVTAKEDPRIKSGGDENLYIIPELIMPWLDHGILFVTAKEDPRIKSGGDENSYIIPELIMPWLASS